ncbi:tetratricopeptide repeat protein [Pseudomonas cremoricolorata]|uniref:tetratricopeptide repeat protein n=1 Tax=Pseudomonas cremoricolorata TaxID=157783 RepID=UPI0004153CDB|nr:sel1 repeat family protein [Pseudomonas cremoricolorata]
MSKALSLLLIIAALSGCESFFRPADFDDPIIGLRCLLLAGEKPYDWRNLSYITKYSNYGNARCTMVLGKIYQEGLQDEEQDFSKARKLFAKAAETEPAAHALLGQMAKRGEGEPVDYVKARTEFGLAGESGALELGKLLEAGQGGAVDVPGAMALYFTNITYFGDDAWNAMDRLRQQGQPLSEEQQQQFRTFWLRSFERQLRTRLTVREITEAVNASGSKKGVTLSFRFTSQSGKPQVVMTQGSGNAEVDRWIMKAASYIHMDNSPPLTDESGQLSLDYPMVFNPGSTERMWYMCGKAPCKD